LVLSYIYRDKIEMLNLKPIVQLGASFMAILNCFYLLIVVLAQKGICRNPIPFLFFLVVLQGVSTCFLWPRFVGWISACHEGKTLNHRLGAYNLCWSTAGMIGPFIGGHLVQHSLRTPLITSALVSAISFVCVCFAKSPVTKTSNHITEPLKTEHNTDRLKVKFMLCARLLIFVTMVCIGIIRSQVPLLFKFSLGFTESDYGTAFTIMSISTFVLFVITGRTNKWHYKLLPMFLISLMIGLCMLFIIISKVLWLDWIAMSFAGAIYAFLYASHLYYIISGAKQRATKMAIHEITLCLGTIVGSFSGGFLSDNFGRYSPYYLGLTALAIGMIGVVVILIKYRKPQRIGI
ncbi:MAG TPA: MFS transporter, partial [Sedimentisphaerales bacterium]|nr:MFS transporter [Sedimentisphaerales bacterium]